MESIDLLKAKINLQTTIIKFTSSIEELQKKHPERHDLIDSMLSSLMIKSEEQIETQVLHFSCFVRKLT